MRKIYQSFLPVILFMTVIIQVKAQDGKNMDVIPNGGFEQWKEAGEPVGWRIASDLNPEKVQEKHPESTGRHALKIWLNGGSVFLGQPVSVKAGKPYTLSFWHKGSVENCDIAVTLFWYDNGVIKSRKRVLLAKAVKDEWRKAEVDVTIPDHINRVGMGLRTRSHQGYMLFDDVSMVLKENGTNLSPALEAPAGLRIKAYQNEMEIAWNKIEDEAVQWEVVVDDRVETVTSGNLYVKTKLKPESEHHVKVRAVKGEKFSPYAERKGWTQRMVKAEDSEDRIPYLRTVNADGNCEGRFLKLYYNELANPNAKISYKLDGVAIEPRDHTLEFPEFEGTYKQFRLEIHIDEGEGCEWEIMYPQLGVRRTEK